MEKITVINKESLEKLKACKDGIRFFTRNIGELSVEKLKLVNGDYEDYVWWLKNAIKKYNSGYVKPPVKEFERVYNLDGSWFEFTSGKFDNELSYKDSDGYWEKYTLDEYGNVLTFKNKRGYSYEYTRDKYGNKLSYKDNEGYWTEYTRDKYGNELTRKDNEGHWTEYTRCEIGNILTHKDNSGVNITYEYEHTKEYFKMYKNDKLILTVFK